MNQGERHCNADFLCGMCYNAFMYLIRFCSVLFDCFTTMIDAFYPLLLRNTFMTSSQVQRNIRLVVFSGYSDFPHQLN